VAGRDAVADDHDLRVNSVAINFVTTEDVKMLREIEQFYNTEISEMVSSYAARAGHRQGRLTSLPLLRSPSTLPTSSKLVDCGFSKPPPKAIYSSPILLSIHLFFLYIRVYSPYILPPTFLLPCHPSGFS
jgi:hypothetical protein